MQGRALRTRLASSWQHQPDRVHVQTALAFSDVAILSPLSETEHIVPEKGTVKLISDILIENQPLEGRHLCCPFHGLGSA